MYLARDILHCKPGKVRDMVAKFKQVSNIMKTKGMPVPRIYTDVSGERYWTVVMETEFEDIDAYSKMAQQSGSDPEFAEAFKGYHDLIVEGRRELFHLE